MTHKPGQSALPAALDDERSRRPALGYNVVRVSEQSRTDCAHTSVHQDGSGLAPAMYARPLAALHSGCEEQRANRCNCIGLSGEEGEWSLS